MDYEKAYKAVLQTAAQWIKDGCTDKEKICLECVFPELRGGDDERIRKEIVSALKFANDGGVYDKHIAYLEKQKEQKPAVSREEILHQLFQNGSITLSDYLYLTEEQKPAEWSEEDEKQLDDIISIIREAYEHGITISETRHRNAYSWLNNLRPSWKPSEEQMKALNKVRTLNPGLDSLYQQLKNM